MYGIITFYIFMPTATPKINAISNAITFKEDPDELFTPFSLIF
jgi:hypothetical protein